MLSYNRTIWLEIFHVYIFSEIRNQERKSNPARPMNTVDVATCELDIMVIWDVLGIQEIKQRGPKLTSRIRLSWIATRINIEINEIIGTSRFFMNGTAEKKKRKKKKENHDKANTLRVRVI